MTKNKKGFTIIEVVLVLAIAGLIFLMVFIALPALQRSQRNTRRRSDMARILSAVNDFQANNNGKSPVEIGSDGNSTDKRGDFIKNYVDETCNTGTKNGGTMFSTNYDYNCSGDQFRDPDGSNYGVIYTTAGLGDYINSWGVADSMRQNHRFMLAANSKCTGNEERPLARADGQADIAIVYVLEGGAVYCGDNQ